MTASHPVRHWVKDEAGNHVPACQWRPDEEMRMAALWLRLWRYLDARGSLPEFGWNPLCACGYSIEVCPCALEDRAADG